jgi:hypothetical protein
VPSSFTAHIRATGPRRPTREIDEIPSGAEQRPFADSSLGEKPIGQTLAISIEIWPRSSRLYKEGSNGESAIFRHFKSESATTNRNLQIAAVGAAATLPADPSAGDAQPHRDAVLG